MTQVEEIKQKVDIADLVGESVALKASGRNFKANCPFHNERTPSFYVFPERQSWHCFGACAVGGDVLSFVMRRDGSEFSEALQLLADRVGVKLISSQVSKERSARSERLKGINREAAMFFHELLVTSPEGKTARDYLASRGLHRDTSEEYRLGYSPSNPDGLLGCLKAAEFTEQEILASGLLRQRDNSAGMYPFFRDRLIIPIQDSRSDYLGFGARSLGPGSPGDPKYINSTQSEIFDKSAVLYGLNRASETIREGKMAVIVEGYMDVLTAHQNGFRNVVASMGTSLTERQVGSLRRLANTFVLALDPDAAGDEATLRSLESSWRILDQPGRAKATTAALTGPDTTPDLVLKVMNLPRGQDPDLLIREAPEDWMSLIDSATPVIDYVFQATANRFDATTTKGKSAITDRLAPFIHKAPNIFEKNELIRKLANVLKEEENVVKSAIGGRRTGRRGQVRFRGGNKSGSAPYQDPTHDPAEVYCVAILLRYPELRERAASLTPEHFAEAHTQEIFRLLAGEIPLEGLKERLDPNLRTEFDALFNYPLPPADYQQREKGLGDCILRLEKRLNSLRQEALSEQFASGGLTFKDAADRAEELKAERAAVDRRV